MREQLKQQLKNMLVTLGKAEAVLDSRSKTKDEEAVYRLLEDMQGSAMAIGSAIEVEEGLETEAVRYLEEYCELLWQFLTAEELKERFRLGRALAGIRGEIAACLEKEIPGRIEVVFLVCRAQRWKQMGRLWDAAKQNPDYDCRVLAAPYRDCRQEERADAVHNELAMFPASAEAMDYEDYDMKEEEPDLVFVDGSFAETAKEGCLPAYDFARVREFSRTVIYMPEHDDGRVTAEDCMIPPVRESDMIIVSSQKVKDAYETILGETESGRKIIKKISVLDWVETKTFSVNYSRTGQEYKKNKVLICQNGEE